MRDKRKKFIELAEKRVTKALHAVRLIGNLSNRNYYTYSETDVKKIAKALDNEVRDLRRRFGEEGGAHEVTFKLTA